MIKHLSDLDETSRKEFLADYPPIYLEVESLKKDGYNPSVEDIIEVMTTESDLTYIAAKIGADILFERKTRRIKQVSEAVTADTQEYYAESIATEFEPPEDNELVSTRSKKIAKKPKLSIVAEEYFEEMKHANVWRLKSELEKRTAIAKLIEIIGDIKVDKLSHGVARSYKKALIKLPANMRKDPRYRDKTIKQIIGMNDVKPIAVNTVNNNLSTVIAFITWARKNGYVRENYFEGLKLRSEKSAQEERKAFSDKDIKKIFDPDKYLVETAENSARYWIPLLALFTGCRLNELCQLHVRDIKKVDGLWCMDINADSKDKKNPKKLKNKASARIIPIHPKLIEIGFIDFVDKQKQSKSKRLFPELLLRIDGFSKQTGQWFNASYLRKKISIKDPKKSFHSFRHSVADGLKQQGVAESYISEYLGHSTGKSETSGRYGKRYQPKVLMDEVVKRIDYGVDFKDMLK